MICIGINICNNEIELPFIFDSIERIQNLFFPDNRKIPIIIAYDESYDTSLGFILSKMDKFQIHILKNKNLPNFPTETSNICDERILAYIRDYFPEMEHLLTIQPNGFTFVCEKRESLQSICELYNNIHIYPKSACIEGCFVI